MFGMWEYLDDVEDRYIVSCNLASSLLHDLEYPPLTPYIYTSTGGHTFEEHQVNGIWVCQEDVQGDCNNS